MSYKVSVCIPVYNSQQYLEACIDSLVNQSLKEIQLIFVNDGSTDNSKAILDKYKKKHKNIVVIEQKNTGLGGARNAAIKIAEGEYLGFVDSDDFVDKEMFKVLYELAIKEKTDIAICNINLYPNNNSSKRIWFTPYDGVISGEFLNRNTQPWNKIVSRKLISDTGYMFNEKNGDGQIVFLLLNAKKIISTNKRLYYYRTGHDSMSTNYKLENFIMSLEYSKQDLIKIKTGPYAENFKEYFEYRIIYESIQLATIAALQRDKSVYHYSILELKKYDYKNNKFIKNILRKEYSLAQYVGMTYILPLNYYISGLILGIVYRIGKL